MFLHIKNKTNKKKTRRPKVVWLVGKIIQSDKKKNHSKRRQNTTITLTGSGQVFEAVFPLFLLFCSDSGSQVQFPELGFKHNETPEVKNIIAPHSF